MKRIILISLNLLLAIFHAGAEDFLSLRNRVASSSDVILPQGVSIEGVIVSDRNSLNMADNPNVAWNKVDLSVNFKTLYIQSEDGKYGFRILSNSVYNTVPRFAKVKVDLSGATLMKESDPERYTIKGIDPEDFTVLAEDVVPQKKCKKVSELKDEDIYTYVTLKDLELSEKQGAYTNVYEPGVQRTWLNEFKGASKRTDSWPCMLKDDDGYSIYMLINTKCTWRRTGDWLPQGTGDVSGVIVYSEMRRHGGVGRYSIRPTGPSEIKLDKASATNYVTVVEWNWNRNYECALNLERGLVEWVVNDELPADRILADEGIGYLSTTCGAKLSLTAEYDARNAQDGCETTVGGSYGQGRREYGAVSFRSNVKDWYRFSGGEAVPEHAILIETTTKEITTGTMTLDLSWVVGHKYKIANAWGFPSEWQVSWSIDGTQYHKIEGILPLRPLYWNDKKIEGIGERNLSYDAAMGYLTHSLRLPAELLGQEKVYIRISPASDALVFIPADSSSPIDKGKMRSDFSQPFYLNVGKIAIKTTK